MKIPETSANVGAYYGNEENGQWQPNGVIIDSGVGGGVVGSGDAGVHRPPVYPVHLPRPQVPAGYVMAGAFYPPGAYPAVPAAPTDDFEDYMWMENEEEFDKQVMQQLEEEALMEQCIEAMLEDEQRERNNRPVANGHKQHLPTTSKGAPSLSLEETVSRSTLNPLAAEFVPIRVRPTPANTEDKPEPPEPPAPEVPQKEVEPTSAAVESRADATDEPKTEEKKTRIEESPWWSKRLNRLKRTATTMRRRIRCAAPVRRAKVVGEYLEAKAAYDTAVQTAREQWERIEWEMYGYDTNGGVYELRGICEAAGGIRASEACIYEGVEGPEREEIYEAIGEIKEAEKMYEAIGDAEDGDVYVGVGAFEGANDGESVYKTSKESEKTEDIYETIGTTGETIKREEIYEAAGNAEHMYEAIEDSGETEKEEIYEATEKTDDIYEATGKTEDIYEAIEDTGETEKEEIYEATEKTDDIYEAMEDTVETENEEIYQAARKADDIYEVIEVTGETEKEEEIYEATGKTDDIHEALGTIRETEHRVEIYETTFETAETGYIYKTVGALVGIGEIRDIYEATGQKTEEVKDIYEGAGTIKTEQRQETYKDIVGINKKEVTIEGICNPKESQISMKTSQIGTENETAKEPVQPQKDPPEVSAADVQPITEKSQDKRPKEPKKDSRPKQEVKKPVKTEVKPKPKPQVIKSETKVQPKKKEVKSVKSEGKFEEKRPEVKDETCEEAPAVVEAPKVVEKAQPSPVEDPSIPKPINYAAAAKANKPKKPVTPPASDKSTPPPQLPAKPKIVEKVKKPEKPPVKDKVNAPRKNSMK